MGHARHAVWPVRDHFAQRLSCGDPVYVKKTVPLQTRQILQEPARISARWLYEAADWVSNPKVIDINIFNAAVVQG